MKRCTICGETKAEDEFHRNKDRSDGRDSRCRKCMNERFRRYREENREADRERVRRYREEHREEHLEKRRRYHEEYCRVSEKYAFKSGKFSLEEDLVVMRTDMTILEIAIDLGRTYTSVRRRRERLRKKEKTNV